MALGSSIWSISESQQDTKGDIKIPCYFPGLIEDSLTVFQWILANANNGPVYLWGHSLGSGYVGNDIWNFHLYDLKHIYDVKLLIFRSVAVAVSNILTERSEKIKIFFSIYCSVLCNTFRRHRILSSSGLLFHYTTIASFFSDVSRVGYTTPWTQVSYTVADDDRNANIEIIKYRRKSRFQENFARQFSRLVDVCATTFGTKSALVGGTRLFMSSQALGLRIISFLHKLICCLRCTGHGSYIGGTV